jgi:hypothetical protein
MVLNFAATETKAVEKFPIEVVRLEIIEVLEGYVKILKKLLEKVESVPG